MFWNHLHNSWIFIMCVLYWQHSIEYSVFIYWLKVLLSLFVSLNDLVFASRVVSSKSPQSWGRYIIQRAPYQVNNNYMSKKSRCVELNLSLLARRQASKVFMLTILNQKLISYMLKRRMKLRVRQGISVLKMFEIWFWRGGGLEESQMFNILFLRHQWSVTRLIWLMVLMAGTPLVLSMFSGP